MPTHIQAAAAELDELPFGIAFDGRAYHYRSYCYEHLQDAINYAKRERRRPNFVEPPPAPPCPNYRVPLTVEQRLQMEGAGIVLVGTRFCYGPYRYDHLADALNYAKRAPGLGAAATCETVAP